MTLTSNNYVFEGKSEGTTKVSDVFATDDVNRFTITKAAAPTVQPVELTVINGLAKTYLVNLPALPTLGDNCKYGSIKYEACNFDFCRRSHESSECCKGGSISGSKRQGRFGRS